MDPTNFYIGNTVRLGGGPLTGRITAICEYDDEPASYRVEYLKADGTPMTEWFPARRLEAVEA